MLGQSRASDAETPEAMEETSTYAAQSNATINYNLPFLLLFGMVVCLLFVKEVVSAALLSLALYHVNSRIHSQSSHNSPTLLYCSCICIGSVTIFYILLSKMHLWNVLVFSYNPPTRHFYNIMWTVYVTDVIVRLVLLQCIICIRGLNGKSARVEQLLESVVYVYRVLLPSPLWITYITSIVYASSFQSVMGALYISAKCVSLYLPLAQILQLTSAMMESKPVYGEYCDVTNTSTDEESGSTLCCPICYEGFSQPVALGCTHVFCEMCISKWLISQCSCPLCRTPVRNAGIWNPSSSNAMQSSVTVLF